jgi:hypothetical protein
MDHARVTALIEALNKKATINKHPTLNDSWVVDFQMEKTNTYLQSIGAALGEWARISCIGTVVSRWSVFPTENMLCR